MTTYAAFLRAINVGGHVVKMDRLRRLVESLGHAQVETLIASGNVLFESAARDPQRLESAIALHLERELGYEVATFVRSAAELEAIAAHRAFPASDIAMPGTTVYVGFLAEAPPPALRKTVESLASAVDAFHFHGRELYWLCRARRVSDSEFSGARLEKLLKAPATLRNLTTVAKMAERCRARGAAARTRSP
jgi:uncharacterized protein (DUF1697 family)